MGGSLQAVLDLPMWLERVCNLGTDDRVSLSCVQVLDYYGELDSMTIDEHIATKSQVLATEFLKVTNRMPEIDMFKELVKWCQKVILTGGKLEDRDIEKFEVLSALIIGYWIERVTKDEKFMAIAGLIGMMQLLGLLITFKRLDLRLDDSLKWLIRSIEERHYHDT